MATIAAGTLQRKRLQLTYEARYSGELTNNRVVSPQQLSFYKGNWYLTAWCHLREGIRNFSLDRASGVKLLDTGAKNVSQAAVDKLTRSAFGIISATELKIARLSVSRKKAPWVLDEVWHEYQRQGVNDDGSGWLEVPYSHSFEIVAEVLRHGGDVVIESPPELRAEARRLAELSLQQHS